MSIRLKSPAPPRPVLGSGHGRPMTGAGTADAVAHFVQRVTGSGTAPDR
jgi:hypothetical protein